jgi:hypothetical protein
MAKVTLKTLREVDQVISGLRQAARNSQRNGGMYQVFLPDVTISVYLNPAAPPEARDVAPVDPSNNTDDTKVFHAIPPTA